MYTIQNLLPNLANDKVEYIITVLIAVIGLTTTLLTIKEPHKICLIRSLYAVLGTGALITSQIWLVLYGICSPLGIIGAISAVLGLHALVLPELRIQISYLKKARCFVWHKIKKCNKKKHHHK